MAVQAQHPSNVLFLNRNGQEGQGSSLPFNNGESGNNSRKRAREASTNNNNIITTAPMNNQLWFSLQTQPSSASSQLVDLSQLQSRHLQPNVVSTGLRLSPAEKNQQLQRQHNHHHQQHDEQSSIANRSGFMSAASEEINAQIKRQADDLERLIQAQGEQLRRTLAESRRRHYRSLVHAAQEFLSPKLREKEAELEKAMRRNAELQSRAAQLAEESTAWQARVRTQEAEAASLQAQLQRAVVSAQDSRRSEEVLNCAEDAESCHVDPDRVAATPGPPCRACGWRAATVVSLPCRHVSLCRECDRLAQACPVCRTLKNSSVEVLFS